MLVQKVMSAWKNNNQIDIVEFVQSLEPLTPGDIRVQMGVANKEELKSCIIWSIYRQKIELGEDTTKLLLGFFNDEMDLRKTICLQVLVHLAKMDIDLVLTYAYGKMKPSRKDYYKGTIFGYLNSAIEDPAPENEIKIMPDEKCLFIKDNLKTDGVVEAIRKTLDLVEIKMISVNIKKCIDEMTIYCVQKFAPFSSLRGCCLTDGILVNLHSLAQPGHLYLFMADLLTLSIHETVHYLARLSSCNFAFSSQYMNENKAGRKDPILEDIPLELGRVVELALFDNHQVSWSRSSLSAAKVFMDRLKSLSKPPFVKDEEYEILGLNERFSPSVGFGIDFENKFEYE